MFLSFVNVYTFLSFVRFRSLTYRSIVRSMTVVAMAAAPAAAVAVAEVERDDGDCGSGVSW